MFTGIVQAVGTVRESVTQDRDLRLQVTTGKLDLTDVKLGDSIAVSGICLTVVQLNHDGFWADISAETLHKTTAGGWRNGTPVNLEKALTPSTRLGGHLVSGHVDGIGAVQRRATLGRAEQFTISTPTELMRYIAVKGSICVDGVSLTVNALSQNSFDLTLVPHTLAETSLAGLRPGAVVNLEVDIIARYLERLLHDRQQTGCMPGKLSEAFLAEHGFIK